MEFPQASKFAFNVRSTTQRAPKTSEPELQVIAGLKGKFRLNEAATKLLNLKPTDYLAFISNEEQIDEIRTEYAANNAEVVAWVDEQGGLDALKVQWGIAKGWKLIDAAGNELTTKKPLTKKEEEKLRKEGKVDDNDKVIAPEIPAYKGSRLASKMKEVRTGMILEGTDSNNAPELRKGYNEDMHVVYSVKAEPIPATFPNGSETVDVSVFLIEFNREEEKIERNVG
jgi:hypothetical protein